MSGEQQGLYDKYRVERLNDPDGKHAGCEFFVLDPRHDPIAREALLVYARRAASRGNFPLAKDLRLLVERLEEGEES